MDPETAALQPGTVSVVPRAKEFTRGTKNRTTKHSDAPFLFFSSEKKTKKTLLHMSVATLNSLSVSPHPLYESERRSVFQFFQSTRPWTEFVIYFYSDKIYMVSIVIKFK